MSADELREAARLMRERAQAADKGIGADRWYSNLGGYVELDDFLEGEEFNMVADTGDRAFSDHIASWHPAVALAVADWLDQMARGMTGTSYGDLPFEDAALAVGRAYLGSDAA